MQLYHRLCVRPERRAGDLLSGLGVAHLTALELEPVAFVAQAAEAGFSAVGLRLHPASQGGVCYPLEPGSVGHRRLLSALKDHAMVLHDAEFVQLTPDVEIARLLPLLEGAAQAGAHCLNVSGDDQLQGRLVENFAALCELARPFGLRIDLEFMRWRPIATLQQACDVVSQAGQANAGILVDALHLYRSGGCASDLLQVPPRFLKALQLCDAPAQSPPEDSIIAEAREGRLPPGEGALPLTEVLRAMPAGTELSVEMPYPSLPAPERLALAYRKTRELLAASAG